MCQSNILVYLCAMSSVNTYMIVTTRNSWWLGTNNTNFCKTVSNNTSARNGKCLYSLSPCRKEKRIVIFFKERIVLFLYGRFKLWPFFITHIDVQNIQHWIKRNWPAWRLVWKHMPQKVTSHLLGAQLCVQIVIKFIKNSMPP